MLYFWRSCMFATSYTKERNEKTENAKPGYNERHPAVIFDGYFQSQYNNKTQNSFCNISSVDLLVVLQPINHAINQSARFVACPERASRELEILDGRIVDLNRVTRLEGSAVVSLLDLGRIAKVIM